MSENSLLRIATRGSELAIWQAEYVRERLLQRFTGIGVELIVIKTKGDRILDRPLAEIGGKGLFVKELENALHENRADLAVHSLKDVPAILPEGLELSTILSRENPHDALVFRKQEMKLEDLPQGSLIGTSSLRREAQIRIMRHDLKVVSLRGNVPTRLKKLDLGEVDAAVLAMAGLRRLKLEHRIDQELMPEHMLPAIGQGVLAIEIRKDDENTRNILHFLEDESTRACVTAERKVLKILEGNCKVPLAGYCRIEEEMLHLSALIANPDGTGIIRAEDRDFAHEAEQLGEKVANSLMKQGGKELLHKFSISEE